MVKNLKTTVSAAVLAASFASLSHSTEGSFALGYGVVQRGQGGAGVAMSQDAMSSAINPAATATLGREFDMGIEFFMPFRGYETAPGGMIAPGDVRSGRNIFFVPNMAYNMPIDDTSALTFSIYGNGGANTSYNAVPHPGCPPVGGVFCGGETGVDLTQAFISVGYAKKIGNVSIGIAPTLAVQAFSAEGLAALSGGSIDPTAFSDNGHSWSFGGGIRLGALVDVTDTFRLGISGQTPMWMTRFKDYAGLFEGGGSFDIPASITVGAAWDVRPDVTLMADYQHIFYSGTDAISNPMNTGRQFGADGGPGFGWDDVDVFKVGAEWRQNDKFTWRAGYAFATNPVGPEDVNLGILAPGIVEHHFTGGGSIKINESNTVDFALIYALSNDVTGPAMMSGALLTVEMHQFSASIGWKKKF